MTSHSILEVVYRIPFDCIANDREGFAEVVAVLMNGCKRSHVMSIRNRYFKSKRTKFVIQRI